MKVLIYSHAFAPKIGGVETVVMSLAKGVAGIVSAAGVASTNVTVVTMSPCGSFDDSLLPFRVIRRPSLLGLLQLVRTSDVVHIAGPAFAPLLGGLLLRKPVVLEHHGFQTICPNGQLLYEPTQKPCLGHFMAGQHRQCLRCNAKGGLLRSLKLWLLTFPRRWLCRFAVSNITPTQWLSMLLRLPRMTTIHHGIMTKGGFELPTTSWPPVVAFIGRLVSTKGVDVLLRAASRLKTEELPFTLRIIGDGLERSRLEAQAQAMGLGDRVKFLGYQPDPKLREALEGVGVVVMPSLAGEVFGLVAAENMMRGIVPIVPAGGALAEVVGDAGLVFSSGDEEALSACLRRLLREKAMLESLRHKARQRALQFFRQEQMVTRHVSLYRDFAVDRAGSGVPARAAQ